MFSKSNSVFLKGSRSITIWYVGISFANFRFKIFYEIVQTAYDYFRLKNWRSFYRYNGRICLSANTCNCIHTSLRKMRKIVMIYRLYYGAKENRVELKCKFWRKKSFPIVNDLSNVLCIIFFSWKYT